MAGIIEIIDGEKFLIEKRAGNKVDLTTLAHNQSVAFGDGETYYLLYTKIDDEAAHAEKLAEALDALIGAVQLGEKLGENEFAERMENAKAVLAAYRKGQG